MAFAHRIAVTINNSAGLFALTNHQIAIDLSDPGLANVLVLCRSDGADIAAYAADGTTLLPFWLASDFNQAGGVGTVYVTIASLSIGASLLIYLAYDDPAQSTSLGSFSATMMKLVTDSDTVTLCHMDDGSGATLVDAAGLHNGTIVGGTAAWLGTDGGNWKSASPRMVFASGNCPVLNGTNQYLTFGSLFDTWPASGSFMLWFRPDATVTSSSGGPYRILTKWNGAPGADGIDCEIDHTDTAGALRVSVYASSVLTTFDSQNTTWTSGVWYHLCLSWGGAGIQLYVNGRLEAQAAGVGVAMPGSGSSHPFTLGAYNNSSGTVVQFLPGAFDEFLAQSRQALPEEVHAAYARRQYKAGMELSGRLATATRSTVISPSGIADWERYLTIEMNVRREAPTTWKAWYSGNNRSASGIGYATSTDGLTWAKSGANPVIPTEASQSDIISDGATGYIAYYCDGYGGTNHVKRRTSADGVTWSAAATVITAVPASWMTVVANMKVLREDASTWAMLLEGRDIDSSAGIYRLGLFTSSDGIAWSAYGSNPLTDLELYAGGSYSGAWFDKVGSTYRLFYHVSCQGFGPSCLAYAESANLQAWTVKAGHDPVLFLNGETLVGGAADQVADPSVIDTGSATHVYYDVDRNVSNNGQDGRSDVAVYAGSIAQLLTDLPALSYASGDVGGGRFSSVFAGVVR